MERIIDRMKFNNGYVYEKGESGKWRCPVCDQFTLDEPSDWDYCPVCDALNFSGLAGGRGRFWNNMNLEEARADWKARSNNKSQT